MIEAGGRSTARQILLCSLLLLPASLLPLYLAMAGWLYGLGATLLGFVFLYAALRLFQSRSAQDARQLRLTSVIYLSLLFVLMLAGRTLM